MKTTCRLPFRIILIFVDCTTPHRRIPKGCTYDELSKRTLGDQRKKAKYRPQRMLQIHRMRPEALKIESIPAPCQETAKTIFCLSFSHHLMFFGAVIRLYNLRLHHHHSHFLPYFSLFSYWKVGSLHSLILSRVGFSAAREIDLSLVSWKSFIIFPFSNFDSSFCRHSVFCSTCYCYP